VQGGSAVEAGAVVAAMSIGWPIASIIAGRLLGRIGARPIVLAGTAMLAVGALAMTQLDLFDALWYATIACAVTGFGMGLASTTLMIVIQGAVPWQRRATATGLVQFSRTIGGSVGVGVMGGILAAFVGAASSAILDPIGRSQLSAASLTSGRAALASGLGVTYWLMVGAAVAACVIAARSMPAVELGHQLAEVAVPVAPVAPVTPATD
jgi:MFS family permease